jgi:hypothetical protein
MGNPLDSTVAPRVFVGQNDAGTTLFYVEYDNQGTSPNFYRARMHCLKNDSTWVITDWITIPSAETGGVSKFIVEWKAGANSTGLCSLGVMEWQWPWNTTTSALNLSNGSYNLDKVKIGLTYVGFEEAANHYFDSFQSWTQ